MRIAGNHVQSIWYDSESDSVKIIDQTLLPHNFEIVELNTLSEACNAISSMKVRGAPLIGVTAAYGVYLALRENPDGLPQAVRALSETRPTAVNLKWALDRMEKSLSHAQSNLIVGQALEQCQLIEKQDISVCESIGKNGIPILHKLWESRKTAQKCLNILTHCNAGALAAVDWGTAMSIIYKAKNDGIPLHVWVDETRPRNQGASLTCWELSRQRIPHTLIVDNAGGHLMQTGQVDACIVGSDRTASNGDVCNKIGTYLKALAARANNVPFYAAVPVSSIDFTIQSGTNGISIEERSGDEISHVHGINASSDRTRVRICEKGTITRNFAFDVTPAELITGIITERGVFEASKASLKALRD